MTGPHIIGLTGRAGSGKDTLAKQLVKHHNYVRVAFADALKDAALTTNPYVDLTVSNRLVRLADVVNDYGWDVAKREIPEVRRYLQNYGVSIRDAIPGAWITAAKTRVADALIEGRNVVLTDVRFPDEVKFVRDCNGTLARIDRPRAKTLLYLTGDAAAHASEQVEGLDVDVVIRNNRGVDKLAQSADYLARAVIVGAYARNRRAA